MKNCFLNTMQLFPSGENNMYYGASPFIFQRAAELRNIVTPAETSLWQSLHINKWKVKFRRQHPIGHYVVDFYCHSLKLVIEIDGDIHTREDVKKNDAERENYLRSLGLTILRFTNEDVFKSRSGLLDTIAETINFLTIKMDMGNLHSNSPSGDRGKLYIIKIGGNIIDDEEKLSSFLHSFAAINSPKILVHGGGKLATKLAADLRVTQQLIDGRRITDAETLKIVTMVYAGYINKNIVAQLQSYGCNAIGLSGADGNLMQAHKRQHPSIDYGFVGDVDTINSSLLQSLLSQQMNVVVAPITHNNKGQLLNTNADTIAQEIAQAMSLFYTVHLIYSFEKNGVLMNAEDDATLIPSITPTYYKELKEKQVVFAGMIPKLDNAFAAISKGVQRITIGKAEQLERLIEGIAGTNITHE